RVHHPDLQQPEQRHHRGELRDLPAVPGGGRHRDPEHHARQRDRADARDRHPEGAGGQAASHPRTVRPGGGDALALRRGAGARAGPVAHRARALGLRLSDERSGLGHRPRGGDEQRGGAGVRHLPRSPRGGARPGRGDAQRVGSPPVDARALPFLGLGLSSNLDPAVEPDPWALHAAEPGLLDLVEYSAPVSLEVAEREAGLFGTLMASRARLPALFHPVHLNLAGPELEPADRLAALEAHARAVGSPWVGNDVAWWHVREQALPGYLYVPPPFSEAGLEVAAAHALHVASALSVPLALENPVVVRREGPLHVLDFMARLHARTGCPLVLDVGHLVAAQLAAGLPLETGLDGFPFEAVIEVHVAGAVITRTPEGRGVYLDDHGQPLRSEVLSLLAEVLPRCRALRALVFEGDGHPAGVARRTLQLLRTMLDPVAERAPLPLAPPRAEVPALPPDAPALAWGSFDAAHGRGSPPADVVGARAEQGLRIAVTAEALDAHW